MSEENFEVVTQGNDAWNAGDMDRLRELSRGGFRRRRRGTELAVVGKQLPGTPFRSRR